jgi:SnoaL-like domain
VSRGPSRSREISHVVVEHAADVDEEVKPVSVVRCRVVADPINAVIEKWHAHLRGQLPGGLDELLDDDVVFYSPIVYTPQEGKAITRLYLEAAGQTLPGDDSGNGEAAGDGAGRFRYTKTVTTGDTAVLEFETTVDGKYVNGVDIIRCNDDGRIVEFRVMIRPLQAVNLVHAQMKATLERMNPS